MPLAKAIGQAIFKSLAPDLLGPMEMIRKAKALGGYYRKQDMLSDIRAYTNRIKYEKQILNLAGNKTVPKAWMSDVTLNEPGANYRVFGQGTFYDPSTGKEFDKLVSFYHTDLMKKDDYAVNFKDYFSGYYKEQDIELIGFNQAGMEHNTGKPY